jgi:hypothetical protein
MADFAKWACAAAPACDWEVETPEGELLIKHDAFMYAYAGVREATYALTLDASLVATLVRELIDKCTCWEGTATKLLTALEALANEKVLRQWQWPKAISQKEYPQSSC